MPEPGWFDVAGGKLTTYRRIAQQVVDRIVVALGAARAGPCRTAAEPLLAGSNPPSSGILPPPVRAEARRALLAVMNGPCIWTT